MFENCQASEESRKITSDLVTDYETTVMRWKQRKCFCFMVRNKRFKELDKISFVNSINLSKSIIKLNSKWEKVCLASVIKTLMRTV